MGLPIRLHAACWFAAAGALPGLGVLQIDAGKIASPEVFYAQLIILPGISAACWGAILGPGIASAGRSWRGFKLTVERGCTVPFLSLLTWAPLAIIVALVTGVYPVKLILFATAFMATLGGLLIYPIGVAAGLIVWWLAGPADARA